MPFVLFLVVLFTGLRASTMDYVLSPFARSQGLYKKKPITRFAEQAWLVIVYTVFYPLGVYLYYNSPYFWNMKNLWTHWPSREMPGLLKAYILVQLAFWLQQIIVINIEERRKDHWQMLTHHFITVSLIIASYRYRHTPVANVILMLMDVSDFFLPVGPPHMVLLCRKLLANPRPPFSPARQVPKISRLHQHLRRHLWRLYAQLVRLPPRLLQHDLLLSLAPDPQHHARRLL